MADSAGTTNEAMRRVARPLACLLAVWVSAAACRPVSQPRVEGPQRLLLVMIDTLRPDHLGAYGYPHATSRTIDGLAAAGVLFEQARSTSSWTKPAVASLFTGVGPLVHGVEQGLLRELRGGEADALSTGFRTLAQSFRDQAYAAVSFSANPHLVEATGLVRGFDSARSAPSSRDRLTAQFLEWLDVPLSFRPDSADSLSNHPDNLLSGWRSARIDSPPGVAVERSSAGLLLRRSPLETGDGEILSGRLTLSLGDVPDLLGRGVLGAFYRTRGRVRLQLVSHCDQHRRSQWRLQERRELGYGYAVVEPHKIGGCTLSVQIVLVEPGSEIEIRSLFLLPEEAVRGQRTDRWFAFLHYMNTHLPYRPSPLYAGRHPVDPETDPRPIPERVLERMGSQRIVDSSDLRVYLSRYDAAIDEVDSQLGVILGRLEDLGLLAGTVVVVLSDHGEEFLEHGGLNHGQSLYGELVRIPLILYAPEYLPRGRRVARPVSLLDLYPTLVELFGLEGPDYLAGRSLLRLLHGEGVSGGEAHFLTHLSMSTADKNRTDALIDGRWKLILTQGSGRVELYDLESDPGELNDISELHPVEVERLRVELDRRRAVELARRDRLGYYSGRTTLDDGTLQELRSLGYVD